MFLQKINKPKQPRSPSPDPHQLSESDIPIDSELDIACLDDDSLTAITNLDLREFYYNEVLEELEGRAELIDEDDANALYGVTPSKHSKSTI